MLVHTLSNIITVTPVISTSPAYSSGDQLGDVQTITFARDPKGTAALASLVVIDHSKQKQAMDVFLFDSLPALSSTDNAAFALPKVEMNKCLGVVSIATTDYADGSARTVATIKGIGLTVKALQGSKSIYAVCVARGTPTFATISDLVLRLGFFED